MNPLRWLWRQVFEDDDRPPEPDQLVLLGEPDGEAAAGLWENILKDQGIHCLVKNVSPTAGYPWRGTPIMEVHVLYRDLARAREALGLIAEQDQ